MLDLLIKKISIYVMLLSFSGYSLAAGGSVHFEIYKQLYLTPISYQHSNAGVTMELGHWKSSISNRILPKFYNELSPEPIDLIATSLNPKVAQMYVDPVKFEQIGLSNESPSHFFTFEYDQSLFNPVNFYQASSQIDQLLLYQNQIFNRSVIAPGFSFQLNDNSQLSFAVVFAQQNYSDINFIASEINGFDQLDLYSVKYTESSDGLGLKFGMSQQIFDFLKIDTNFQSRIDMDGFSQLLGVQSDPADFDIPAQVDLSLGLKITARNSINFNAKKTYYSDTSAFVSRSYPDIFLTFLNDFESPDFEWADLTVYSIGLEHEFLNGTAIKLNYSGRQQPPATDQDLTTILNSISSSYNVSLGFTSHLFGGQFDLYASYASKPLNFGRIDFGEEINLLDGKHTEAVMSWVFNF
ncbi:MAG: hypothetical protein L3J52_02245 [Proteobacteria bacterium]|nr:hypothetical protein [Pseudomonadota bacterium]